MKIPQFYIEIKDRKIPVEIRSYRNSNHIKMFFKKGALHITKPTRVSMKKIEKMIKQSEDMLYREYEKVLLEEKEKEKSWQTGEKIRYQGMEYEIERVFWNKEIIRITLEKRLLKLYLYLPNQIPEEEIGEWAKKTFLELLKVNTTAMLQEKLPYWSNITKMEYQTFKVRDALTKYGSCVPATKTLHFTARLIMLPEEVIDAIIVHELCHMAYCNHGKNFYELVESFIPNYKEIDKWLKKNGNWIQF